MLSILSCSYLLRWQVCSNFCLFFFTDYFSHYWVIRILYMFVDTSPLWDMSLKYYLTVYGFKKYFLKSKEYKCIIFVKFDVSVLFLFSALFVPCNKSLPNPRILSFSFMLSFKSFIILSPTFRTMIHLEIISVYHV